LCDLSGTKSRIIHLDGMQPPILFPNYVLASGYDPIVSLCAAVPLRVCSPSRVIRFRYSGQTPARLRCISVYRHGITCMLRRAQQYSHIGSDISFEALSSYRGINVKRTRRSTRLGSLARLVCALSLSPSRWFPPILILWGIYPIRATHARISEAGLYLNLYLPG